MPNTGEKSFGYIGRSTDELSVDQVSALVGSLRYHRGPLSSLRLYQPGQSRVPDSESHGEHECERDSHRNPVNTSELIPTMRAYFLSPASE